MARLYPLDPKELFALQDEEKALTVLTRLFEEEILDQLDDMDVSGLLVDDQVIEGFRQELLGDLIQHRGREAEIYQQAVDKAILRVQGIRQTSH